MGYSIFTETMVDLPWNEVEARIKEGAIVLLPTGVIEAHGPHMCLGVDVYGSYQISVMVKEELEKHGIQTLICPPFYWGINHMTGAFPGSFTTRKSTMKALLYDILSNLKRWGVEYVFNINHHGDPVHCNTIFEAMEEARSDLSIRCFTLLNQFEANRFKLSEKDPFVLLYENTGINNKSSKFLDIHAGESETGMMHRYFPEQVNNEMALRLKSTDLNFKDLEEWRKGGDDARNMTPGCYFGDPAKFLDVEASLEGVAVSMAKRIMQHIER